MSFKGPDSNLSHSFCIDTPAQMMKMRVNEISWEWRHRFRSSVCAVTDLDFHTATVMFSDTECTKCWRNVFNITIIWRISLIVIIMIELFISLSLCQQPSTHRHWAVHPTVVEWVCDLHFTELIKFKLGFLFCQLPCVEGQWSLFNSKFLIHSSVQRSTIQSGGVWIRRLHLAYWSVLQKQGIFNSSLGFNFMF